MTKPRISIIVARAKNGVIGGKNGLLWHISDDLKRFKELTMSHPIIMGRKTYDSIGKPLPGRTSFVVTRDTKLSIPGCVICLSIEQAIEKASELNSEEIFVIGGEEIYKLALPIVDRLYVTEVDLDIKGDAYFPDYTKEFTKEISREERFDEKTGLKYTWVDLER
ncbi:MAG: Dihydrofolate reductase [Parcubacteria group bacterium GW2011_GWB1_38_8]|nr:MAG: Dihydrofolate reductase [Parcubacteria group bacterium GW2011_GWB1_38_8]KKR30056.1 MAG: Dihydrofolate reductase [Parcubacteria group bacterium GW2011_GWC1_39_8]